MTRALSSYTPARVSYAEYVELEASSETKHEFHDGERLAMAGGTAMHSLITLNIAGELRQRLKGGPCRAFESNLKVYSKEQARGVYPDAFVICGPIEYFEADRSKTTVLNPRVIVEVASPSTGNYDRGRKLGYYLSIPSFEQYVIVEQDEPAIEVLTRQSDGQWLHAFHRGLDAIARLTVLGIDLPLAEAYRGVEFPAELKAG